MPNFLNAWTAAAAAAAAIPLLLLLYFLKLRRQELLIPSTLLWKKSIQDLQVNAPFQRLRKNLLLLLQLLLLLLLLLALSRPVLNYTPGAGKLSVIMIDRSASMAARDASGKTRLDEARRRALDLVDSLEKDASAMVIAFDESADIVRSFTSDRALLRDAINGIQPTDRRSRLKHAFQLAEAKASAFYVDQMRPNADRPEIWLYSDGRTLDRDELALRAAEMKYTPIGSDQAPNTAIVSLAAKRNYERPNEVQVFARLANYGPKVVSATVQLSIDGHVPAGGVKSDLLLFPERWTPKEREAAEKEQKLLARDSAEFTFELTRGAVIRLELIELRDALAADNVAQVVVPPPRLTSVLLVTEKGNYWIEKFIQSANLREPGQMSPAQYEEAVKDPQALAAKYDVLFFDRYTPRALPPSGNFIYFAAVPPASRLRVAKDPQGVDLLLKDQLVVDWQRNHPTLRNLNLRFLAKEVLKLQLPPDAEVLVDGKEGPLVVYYREARATHLVVAFDVQLSTWPTNPSFPVFFDAALQYLALGADMDVRQSYPPGATPRIPRYNLQQAGGELKKIRIKGPGLDVSVPVPASGDFALPPLEKVGVYTLEPAIPQFERIAVNLLDPNESDLVPNPTAPGGSGQTLAATAGKSRFELWRWLVAAAVPLCLFEWWVYTRRMHL